MKISILALAALFLLSLNSSAQVDKGQLYGDLFIGRKLWNYNTNMIQPSITVGLSEHSTLGVFYSYTRYKSMPVAGINEMTANVTGVGVSYSYFKFFKNSQKWGWYVNGSLSFNRVTVYEKAGGNTVLNNRYSERNLSLTPGIFFKPSPRIMLYGNIGGIEAVNNRHDFILPRSTFANQVNFGIRVGIGNLKNKKVRTLRSNF